MARHSNSHRNQTVDIRLPRGFSEKFIRDLQECIPDDGSFKSLYLKDNLLSKYCDSKTTSAKDRRARAIEKWLKQERRNANTNQRLLTTDANFGWTTWPRFRTKVRRLISRTLGPVLYPDVILDITHTNGASTRVQRSEIAALEKLNGDAHISSSALKHWLQAAKQTRLVNQTLELQESSVLFTVPKKSDIDRVACKEPEINVALQRSAGNHIRRALRRVGIDLNDQTRNQELARNAVKLGLATIDLSSASDSISNQLVFEFLPFEWYSLLDDLRVSSTTIDGVEHSFEMFSAMGNGFTFELESLLFWAITRTVMDLSGIVGRVSVFGDDIIAPSAIVPRLIRLFHFLGFKTNEDKTFWTGTFRESCGMHYDRGFDVSPFFVRRPVSTLPDLINLLNQLLEWSGRGYGFIPDPEVVRFHREYARYVPERFWGGHSTEDNTSLVTSHGPRKMLVPLNKAIDRSKLDDQAYIHWFMQRENTEKELSVEPERAVAYKAKRRSKGWLSNWTPWLIES